MLNRALRRPSVAVEADPDLKATAHFGPLQSRISALESSIADQREFLNDSVNVYNVQIRQFPDLLLARLLAFGRREYLEVPERAKEDVKIDLA